MTSLSKLNFFFLILFGLQVSAQSVKDIEMSEGTPVKIWYDNGSIIQVLRKETLDEFEILLTVAENSCQEKLQKISCRFKMPYIRQSYAGQWETHATRARLPVEQKSMPNATFGSQFFITKETPEKFKEALARVSKNNEAGNLKELGRLDCDGDVNQIFPNSKKIVFLDETYEGANNELAMHQGYGARVNLNWRRYEDIPIQVGEKSASFGIYRKLFATNAIEYPFGLSYTMQMIFESKNFENEEDKMCQIKWSVNFSRYFDQLQKLYSGEDRKMNLNEYKPLIYRQSEYSNPYSLRFLKKELWNSVRDD